MAKSPFEFNPELMEFRRKDRNTSSESGTSARQADTPAPPNPPDPVEPPLDNVTIASLVEKPEGYIDPTPTRRRRRSRAAVRRKAAGEKSTAWRGVMWVLILIMAVFWVYMLYSQSKGTRDLPGDDDLNIPLDREDVLPAM